MLFNIDSSSVSCDVAVNGNHFVSFEIAPADVLYTQTAPKLWFLWGSEKRCVAIAKAIEAEDVTTLELVKHSIPVEAFQYVSKDGNISATHFTHYHGWFRTYGGVLADYDSIDDVKATLATRHARDLEEGKILLVQE